nr:PorP/SprF family type IX secretion system membrane protein [Pedobacter sp. ASV2]
MKIIIGNTIIFMCLCATNLAYGQLNPMGSTYFQNQYLINPALAGIENGWSIGGAYKAQWTEIEGAPSMQSITGEYGDIDKRIGLGMNLYSESAGVIKRTSVKATFAYHLYLNQLMTNFIDFGLSAGAIDEWIDHNSVKGDLDDKSLSNFNKRKTYFDGDFGIAFRNKALTIQGSLPNLKRFFNFDLERTIADRARFLTAISYKIKFGGDNLTEIEPKVVYRGVQNHTDIIDVGANFSFFQERMTLSGIYHSTNSITFGGGTLYKKSLSILVQYTNNTSELRNYSNGEFEIAIKYKFN